MPESPPNGLTEAAEAAAPDRLDVALAAAFGPEPEGHGGENPWPGQGEPALRLREPYPPTPGSAPGGPGTTGADGFGPGGRYQVEGELARGGMGVILRGRDRDLGRELAIKVLRADHRDNAAMARRFVEEAQIGGQLQHPGVVPVYELGRLPDGRPYFTMRLVRGQTLAALLAARPDPAHDSMRFLVIFSQVCQAVAYAHACGVIHRDLKPANIMVGAFGEVRVMDWGLARVLRGRGGQAGPPPANPDEQAPVRTVRTGPSGGDTQAGSVLGTPAYMAPEQARGEVGRLDERCDVFGLGAVLCEVLTGRPPFGGAPHPDVLRRAARGELDEAHARLDGCGADPGLVLLAKACLAPDPDARPGNAGLVAEGVSVYFARVEKRVRAAEVAEAQAHAANTLIAAMAAREANREGSRPDGADAPATALMALEEALARAGAVPVADQLALYRAAAARVLRQDPPNPFAGDVLKKALVEAAGLGDRYHAAWLLRGALVEVRGLLSFRPLPEADRAEGWPEFTPVGVLMAPLFFVFHLLPFLFLRGTPAYPPVSVAVTLGLFTVLLAGFLWFVRPGTSFWRAPVIHGLWSMRLGHFAGVWLVPLVCRELLGPDDGRWWLACYPLWAVLTGKMFFTMGGALWGRLYLAGLAFFAVAVVMPWRLDWAPVEFGVAATGVVMVAILHLRRTLVPAPPGAASPPRPRDVKGHKK
jgi:hypothetical protein